jgi:hypothetical protein
MSSLDKTFCTFYKECLSGRGCDRAYLKLVEKKVKKVGCLVSLYLHAPGCFMDRKKVTSKTKIVQALRMLFLRSKEHNAALKHYGYTCRCGAKKSVAKGRAVKVEVHHREGVCNWDKIIELIRKELLVSPEKLEILCYTCHKKEHEK